MISNTQLFEMAAARRLTPDQAADLIMDRRAERRKQRGTRRSRAALVATMAVVFVASLLGYEPPPRDV
jgi:hypothetical protein